MLLVFEICGEKLNIYLLNQKYYICLLYGNTEHVNTYIHYRAESIV